MRSRGFVSWRDVLRGLASAGAVSAFVGVVACSGSGSGASCAGLRCPNDPPSTSTSCEQDLSDPKCGGQFQNFLDCASGHLQCTSSGTTDVNASEQAITESCAEQALSWSSCTGGSTSSSAGCGAPGEACCTSGTACTAGCCDSATQKCVSEGIACTGGTTVCPTGGGSCESCGVPNDPCCGGDQCNVGCCDTSAPSGARCVDYGSTCTSLGTQTEACPESGGFCQPCGSDGAQCCPNDTCPGATPGLELTCTNGSCMPCGSLGESCCPGNACTSSSTACATIAGTTATECETCGSSGEPCCTIGTPCITGTCNGTTCM